MNVIPVTRDLQKLLIGNQKLSDHERKAVERFGDLLDKVVGFNCKQVVSYSAHVVFQIFEINPDKRISPRDACYHPFFSESL